MQELKLSNSVNDNTALFLLDVGRLHPIVCSLHSGYKHKNDGVLWMRHHIPLPTESYFTDLSGTRVVDHKELVKVGNHVYRIVLNNGYTDCAVLLKTA